MAFKVIIAGGRDYDDYESAKRRYDVVLSNVGDEIEIVSGSCDDDKGVHTFTRDDGSKVYGADGLGERYAKEKGYRVKNFFAEWRLYGKPAGPIRNKKMAKYADAAICHWDGKSKGTRSMILLAEEFDLKLRVIKYNQ